MGRMASHRARLIELIFLLTLATYALVVFRRSLWAPSALPFVYSRVQEELSRSAVCVIGRVGHPLALPSLRAYVLRELQSDLFIVSPDVDKFEINDLVSSSDGSQNLTEFFDEYSPSWREAPSGGNFFGGLPGYPLGHGAFQLRDRYKCAELIALEEVSRGMKYTHIGVGRFDLLWLHRHPHVDTVGCWIPCRQNDWGGLCDHWAWCTRDAASIYLKSAVEMLPDKVSNTEQHLMLTLAKENVQVERGEVAFVRSCAQPLKTCQQILDSEIYAKPSGGQIKSAVSSFFAARIVELNHSGV